MPNIEQNCWRETSNFNFLPRNLIWIDFGTAFIQLLINRFWN